MESHTVLSAFKLTLSLILRGGGGGGGEENEVWNYLSLN